MPYHVRITTIAQAPGDDELALDLSEAELESRFIQPYNEGSPITTRGKTIIPGLIERIRINFTKQRSARLVHDIVRQLALSRASGIAVAQIVPPEWYVTEEGEDVTDQFITGPPGTAKPSANSTKPQATVDDRYVMVVHGQDAKARTALFQFLRSINLHPIEWSEARKATGEPSPQITAILEKAFSMAKAVVVLMTGDDEARLRRCFRAKKDPKYETTLMPQPRQNVLFEAGMALGRHPDRTVLVELGSLRPFTDISGVHLVKLDNSVAARQELASRLEDCGCPVNLTGADWHKAGTFKVKRTPTSRGVMRTTRNRQSATDAAERDRKQRGAHSGRHKSQVPSAPEADGTGVYAAFLEPMLHSGGELSDDANAISGKVWHVPPDSQSEPILYGPYVKLDPGAYCVVFRLKMCPDPERPNQGRVRCDVAYSKGRSFKFAAHEDNVIPRAAGDYETKSLLFDVKKHMKDALFEFRICRVKPGFELWVDKITITRR